MYEEAINSPGITQRARTEVALQAGVPPVEARRIGVAVKAVKDHSLPGVERRHLQEVAAANKSHHHVVAEVQRAGVVRLDSGRLEAGLRKHQDLRVLIEMQHLEELGEVSAGTGGHLNFPAGQIPIQARHAVVQRTRIVLNRRVIDRKLRCLTRRLIGYRHGHRHAAGSHCQGHPWSYPHTIQHISPQAFDEPLAKSLPSLTGAPGSLWDRVVWRTTIGEIPQACDGYPLRYAANAPLIH